MRPALLREGGFYLSLRAKRSNPGDEGTELRPLDCFVAPPGLLAMTVLHNRIALDIPRRLRDHLRHRADHDGVVEAEAAEAVDVDSGLDRINFAGYQPSLAERHVVGIFVPLHAHAVTGAVNDVLAEAGGDDHRLRGGVDGANRIAGARGGGPRLVRGARGFVERGLAVRRRADEKRALVLGHHAVEAHVANIHDAVALLDDRAGRHAVAVRRGGGGPAQGEAADLRVLAREAARRLLGNERRNSEVQFLQAAARPDVLAVARLAPVGERAGVAVHFEFLGAFDETQFAQLRETGDEPQVGEQRRHARERPGHGLDADAA